MSGMLVSEVVLAVRGQLLRGLADQPVHGGSIDTRTLQPGQVFFALPGTRCDGHRFVAEAARKGAGACIVSDASRVEGGPGALAGCALIEVEDVARALYELAAAWRRRLGARVVAVTGSCGKSTTKEMLRAALGGAEAQVCASPASFNNHLGVPLSILAAPAETRSLILEMGTNQPGDIQPLTRLAWPEIALITTIGPSHLERLGSVEGVARAKAEIFCGLAHGGLAVLSSGDPHSLGLAAEQLAAGRRVRTFGRGAPPAGVAGHLGLDGQPALTTLDDGRDALAFRTADGARWRLPGRNLVAVDSALATITIARELGLADAQIADGLLAFRGLPMRQQLRLLRGGVLLIDDAYNANPISMGAALEQLQLDGRGRRKLAVLGEMGELGEAGARYHAELGARAASCADFVWSVGPGAAPLAAAAAPRVPTRQSGDSDEVAAQIDQVIQDGDVVLVKGSRTVGLERVVNALVALRPLAEGEAA